MTSRRPGLAAALALLSLASAAGGGDFADWAGAVDAVYADGPAVVRVSTAALILGGQPGGSIGIGMLAVPLPLGDLETPVFVLTAIDAATLPAGEAATLALFVYALGPAGGVAASTSQAWTIDASRLETKRGLFAFASLDLPPGEYTLRVLVSHRGSGEVGLQALPLVVPPRSDGGTALFTPWLLEPAEPWLVALPPERSDPPAFPPLVIDAGPYLPVAGARLESGASAAMGLLARQAGHRPRLVARFENDRGGVETPITLRRRQPAPWPGVELLLLDLRVPDLPPGRYSLRAVLERPDGEPALSPVLPVVVEGPTPQPRVASPAHRAPSAERAGARRRRVLPRTETVAGYHEALRLLADGEADAAAAALRDLEIGADRLAPGAVFLELEKIQWEVLESLAGESWAALLPVVLLHGDLVADYRGRGSAPLSEHSIRMSRRLATALGRQAATDGERAAAARALIDLAALLLRAGRLGECEELVELAQEQEKTHPVAWLVLAVSRERRGAYREAAAAFQRLLDLAPDHAEGRLRYALSLERLGETARSRPLLESLTRAEVPPWIGVLAFEEAARIDAREGRLERAAERLGRALERWPDDPGLLVQRAYLLDRSGRPREAREVIVRLLATGRGRESFRRRYNRWPSAELEASRRELEAAAERRLADLGRRLEATSP